MTRIREEEDSSLTKHASASGQRFGSFDDIFSLQRFSQHVTGRKNVVIIGCHECNCMQKLA